MKRIMNVYESVRVAIRISFLGFVLIAFGFLIQNESVNIFYTFRNVFILMLAEGCLQGDYYQPPTDIYAQYCL